MEINDQGTKKSDLFFELVEQQPDIVVKFDLAGKILYANPVFLSVVGETEESIIGSTYFQTVEPEELERANQYFKKLQTPPYEFEHRESIKTPEGVRWFLFHPKGILGEDGKVNAIISVGRDITAQVEAEEKRIKSEERFRKIFETSPIGILTANLKGNITSCNPAFAALSGYEVEDFVNIHFRKLPTLIPQKMSVYISLLGKVIKGDHFKNFRFEWKHKNGDIRVVQASSSFITNKEDDSQEIQILVEDITAVVEAQRALEKSNAIINATSDAVITVDLQNHITFWNKGAERLYGYSSEEVLGKPIDIVYEEDVYPVLQNLRKELLRGVDIINQNLRSVTKSGQKIEVLLSLTSLKDKSGAISEIVGIAKDISDLKQIEEELKRAQHSLNDAQRIGKTGSWEYHIKSKELWWSDGVYRIFNIDPKIGKPERGKKIIEAIVPEQRKTFETLVLGAMENQTDFSIEFDLSPTTNNEKRTLQASGEVILDENEQPYLQRGFIIDITERKQAEDAIYKLNQELEKRVEQRTIQLQEANQELEAFSYSVSHDLQAPLRAIVGYSEIINLDYGQSLPEEVTEYFERICSATDKMTLLINGLLGLARLGRENFSIEPIEVDSVAQQVFDEISVLEKDRTIQFVAETGQTILADKEMISILLVNLIGNAIKYTRGQQVAKINLMAKIVDDKPEFSISDNGIGFDMQYADKLFQPFQRMVSEEEFEGTGIGLSLVKKIITYHNGKIWVESEKGKGTTFYFTFDDTAFL